MTDDKPSASDADSLLSAWIRAASDYWGSMLRNWPGTTTEATGDKTAAETDP